METEGERKGHRDNVLLVTSPAILLCSAGLLVSIAVSGLFHMCYCNNN